MSKDYNLHESKLDEILLLLDFDENDWKIINSNKKFFIESKWAITEKVNAFLVAKDNIINEIEKFEEKFVKNVITPSKSKNIANYIFWSETVYLYR